LAFLGQDTVRFKIVVENEYLQQVKHFKRLCFEISCKNEKDIQQKVENFS
jgi:hypothetical protein